MLTIMAAALLAASSAAQGKMPADVREQLLRALIKTPTPAERAKAERQEAAMVACRRSFMGQDYLPQPAMWKVTDADTTLYLLGTIHLLPLDFDWQSAQVKQAIADARLLITEDGSSDSVEPTPSLPKAASKPQPPIADRVRGERRAKWLGMAAIMPEWQVAKIDGLPDLPAAIFIALAAEEKLAPPNKEGADFQLEKVFKEAKKPIAALEDGKAVAARISGTWETGQRRLLERALDKVGRPESLAHRLAPFHRWAKGEENAKPLIGPNGPRGAVALRDALLTERNAAWADALQRRMAEPGVILVAAGAGHFYGKDSLLDQLAKRGLTAERVTPTTPPAPRPAFLPKPAAWSDCQDYLFGDKVPQAGG